MKNHKCNLIDVHEYVTGRQWFYAGEVQDNYKVVLACRICGKEFDQDQYKELKNDSERIVRIASAVHS